MYFLYNLALLAAVIVTAPWWLLRLAFVRKHRAGFWERLGRVPNRLDHNDNKPAIWLHAVSVGEVLACAPLVAHLRREFPDRRILISTTTATGQRLARERFGAENVFYFPLDLGFAVRAYLRRLQPQLVVLAEAEFWPNFLRLAKASGAKIAVVNARISDRSLAGYDRWRRWMKTVLANVDLFLAQSGEDAERLRQIGAPAERVQVTGNLKFDPAPARESPLVAKLRAQLRGAGRVAPVLVAGSTMAGEEAMLLAAYKNILTRYPTAALILAPRHPERFAEVESLLRAENIRHVLRSRWQGEELAGAVFLLDTIGELAALYSLADIAFVGGSLVPTGGHNILEPARFGVAVVVGPHTENFREMFAVFRKANALVITAPESLEQALLRLLEDPDERRRLGAAGARMLEANTGATARTLAGLQSLMAAETAAQPELVQAGRS